MNLKDRSMIKYLGPVPSSKSLINRALLLEQSFSGFKSKWSSQSMDVLLLDKALRNLNCNELNHKELNRYDLNYNELNYNELNCNELNHKELNRYDLNYNELNCNELNYNELNCNEFYVGEGGSTFRFLSVLLSSLVGEWRVKASSFLLKRPHDDLFNFFDSQSIDYKVQSDTLSIRSKGWDLTQPLQITSLKTTQVASAVMLVALKFKKSFSMVLKNSFDSNYFLMTEKLINELGVQFTKSRNRIDFSPVNNEMNLTYSIEGDWSSAAFLYILGALKGEVEIANLTKNSFQPDSKILNLLRESQVSVEGFRVDSSNFGKYKAQAINLKESPDLFPVLSAFFVFSEGETKLFGAPQLAFKESNRIEKVYDLLNLCGYKVVKKSDGLTIKGEGKGEGKSKSKGKSEGKSNGKGNGKGNKVLEHEPFAFDCSMDHRIFMCAYILKSMGYSIEIIGKESINKSFPEFFDLEGKHVFSDRP